MYKKVQLLFLSVSDRQSHQKSNFYIKMHANCNLNILQKMK